MKKLLLLFGLLTLFQTGTPNDTEISQGTTYVWICTGSGAYAYHSSQSCGGLNNCRDEIVRVTLHDAITDWRRRPCRKCY